MAKKRNYRWQNLRTEGERTFPVYSRYVTKEDLSLQVAGISQPVNA